uniref:Fanconi anemia group M protein n=2 Tax=Clastoptera arizonana TaxID=38151 RepID=A0A1B6CWP1_9HEMI
MSNNWSNLLEDEDEDAIFARIKEESYRHFHEVELPRRNSKNNDESYPDHGESSKVNENICEQIDDTSQDILYNGPESGTKGFYLLAGETYIYPTNYPVRDYQMNIVRSALFHNTLVCLPTGLGKTFIAAVVMYNYYRWFPKGKIVFMAPTRPLVAQQIRACHDILAIPRDDSIEMTGTLNQIERAVYWKSRRVFFLTPQVLVNDLRSKVCPATLFKCVVVDEAHRATKEYAYCQVIRSLEEAGAEFRILALSATPGNNVKNVVEVVKNLRISKLEMRGEESLDVAKYTHSKNVQQIVVQLSGEIRDVREQFLNIFEKYARSLRNARVITGNLINTSKFQFLKAGEKLKSHALNNMSKEAAGYLLSDLTVCMSLAHALELLQIYGLRAFQHYLTTGNEEGDKSKAAFTRLKKDGELYELLSNIQKTLAGKIEKKVWSHPKLEEMEKIITEHFISSEENTKAIIFCQYRLVVNEVFDVLSNSNPGIKPIMFVGQSTSRDKCGLPQKKQLEVMKSFRCGEYNVLIATSVAEEGLDIGAVDLLILMEAHRSPVRLVQRLGRTGRHRSGKCIVLLTHGKEVQKFQEAMESRKSYTTKMLSSSVIVANLFDSEPVMLPPGVKPKQQLLNIKVEKHVTPAKPQKQVDIRSAFGGKQSSNKPSQTPYLNIGKLMQVVEELGTTSINFNRINLTDKCYLWDRVKDGSMDSEEFFNTSHSYLSEWNDWNSSLQPTYSIGHSSVTEILCDLLKKANSVQTNDDCLNSQFSVTQVLGKKKVINKKKKDKKTKENIKKEDLNIKMDIRNCFVLAGEKTKLTQQKLWDKLTKSSQKDRPSSQISEKKIIKLDLTLDVEDDDLNINNWEDLKSPKCDEILIMESNNISDKVKKAPSKSKCILSIYEDTMDMVVDKILPTSRVKLLTENLNRVSFVNFCDLKNQISFEVIQNFNVKKTFENIKTPDHENISIKQKIASLALVDIKNIIGGKNQNISQTPLMNKMYKEGMKSNTKIENDLKSRDDLKLIQSQKRKFSEVEKYCSTQNRSDLHSKNNEEELKNIVINTSNVKFPPTNIVIDYKVDKIESENMTRITSMELDNIIPAFKNDNSDIVDLDCLFTEENEISFTTSPKQASEKFDKASLNETLQIDQDKQYSDDLFTEEDNDSLFENTPEDSPTNALSNKSTGCSVHQISNQKNKNNLFFGKNIEEETLKSKQLLLKKSDSLDDFFTEEVNNETNKTFLKASHNAELFTKTILYDEKVSNTSAFGNLLQEDKISELKKTFPKKTEIREKSNLNIYLLKDCNKTVSNDKDISDLDDLFADDVKEDINNTFFKNTKPFTKPKSNFNTLNKSQSTITKLNAEKADENLCDIDDLFGEEINETFIKNQSNSKKINNQYFEKPIFRDTKQICNTSLSNINGKKLQVVIKPKKEEDFVGIDDLFNDEFDWSCVQNTSTNDSDSSKVKNISKCEFDKTKENKFDSFQKSQINPNIKKSNFLQIKIPEDKINFDEIEATTNTNKNGSNLELSPVLRSSQSNANVKITNFCKKNLFPEKNDFCKNVAKQTKFDCFNDTQNETKIISKETIIMKEDEKNELWSVDQLFEDSCDMEESMYTISQLVRKSSEMSLKTNGNLILNEESINKEQKNKTVKKTESCSGSDNFDVINSLVNAEKRSPSILRNISSLHLKSSQAKDDLAYKTNVKNYNTSHLNINNSLNSDISNVNCKNKQPVNDKKLQFEINSSKIFPLESHKMEPVLSGGWLNSRSVSTPLKANVKPSTSKWFNNCDSDSNSDIFESPILDRRKPISIKDSKLKDRKKQKKKTIDAYNYMVNEADVSGPQMSSDEENTSGLDDLDESFINDLTQMPSTSVEQTYLDMEAVYLQTAKSPKIRPGGFKIPEVRKSRLEMDVFSQSMVEDLEDQDCYENDSFCVDDTEIIDNDPSILEIAEQILENRKKNKRKRIRHVSSSSSSCEENRLNKTHSNIVIAQKKKKICVIESDSETDFENRL